jgi:protein ImuB
MSRIVSVWLPRWPILRFLAAQARNPPRTQPVDPQQPFVLCVRASGGPCIVARNAAAEADGVMSGDRLADARAKTALLQVRDADPAADDAALRSVALWATRYTPAVSAWNEENGADGLFLDVAGSAHLFGGEAALMADLGARLARFGLPARLAVADTAGAAWALARFHQEPCVVLASGEEAQALAPLPIEALRLSPESTAALRRLGCKRVGALIGKPRAPFAARFPSELLTRLDQALGRASEPLTPIVPPPVYHSLRYLLEPIVTQDAVVAVARRLMGSILHVLVRDGVGARSLRLALYRVDGEVTTLDVGLALPTRDVAHVARLIDLKLEAIAETVDAGFGFEAVGLAVTIAESMTPRQPQLAVGDAASGGPDAERAQRCANLIDVLTLRLGVSHVRRLAPVESHLPERAEARCSATAAPVWPAPEEAQPRPLLLLPRAEPADVIALVPEGPPQRFRWRGTIHAVARALGPERIASEWWRECAGTPTRDYYLVEDAAGRRFWLYREGLYSRETAAPRWFVHGMFA